MSAVLRSLTAAGPRVRLRPLAEGDRPLVEPWLAEAAAAVRGRGAPREPCGFQELVRALAADGWSALFALDLGDGEPSGLLGCQLAPDGDWCTFTFAALRAGRRVTGYGGEAVLALERRLREAGLAARFRAGVPHGNGLAVYFWLRIGYRPLLRSAWEAGFAPGRTWMVRTEP
ncbi:MAG TPA: hypothetical protein VIO14_12295 [Dehalococcoidia bacterium]